MLRDVSAAASAARGRRRAPRLRGLPRPSAPAWGDLCGDTIQRHRAQAGSCVQAWAARGPCRASRASHRGAPSGARGRMGAGAGAAPSLAVVDARVQPVCAHRARDRASYRASAGGRWVGAGEEDASARRTGACGAGTDAEWGDRGQPGSSGGAARSQRAAGRRRADQRGDHRRLYCRAEARRCARGAYHLLFARARRSARRRSGRKRILKPELTNENARGTSPRAQS